jgi:hypothetical protein
MTMKEYLEDFYRLCKRPGKIEGCVERVSRYINGVRYDIHDDISLINIMTVEDAY